MEQHRITLQASASAALDAIAQAADIWGGEWQRYGTVGTLTLPISVGLRHGLVSGEVTAQELRDETEMVFRIQDSNSKVHVAGVVVLLFGVAGGLILTLWPFYPVLLPLTPVGVILSFAAWFMVASRLRTRTEREFFQLVEEILGEDGQVDTGIDTGSDCDNRSRLGNR